MAKRGMLTPELEVLSEELFGRVITTKELRLIPYLRSVAVNAQRIERSRINDDEAEILQSWVDSRYIEMDEGGNIKISPFFWEKTNVIMFVAYVDYKDR